MAQRGSRSGSRAQFERSIRYYELLDDEGRTLDISHAMAALHLPVSSALASSDHSVWQNVNADNTRIRILDVPVLGLAGRHYLLRIGTSLDQTDEDCWRLRMVLFALIPFIILAHAVNAVMMTSHSMRRLEQAAAAAKQITAFDLSTRLPVTGTGDELDELSTSLNAMISRLQSSFQRMTEFLRTLSHEIRQPLTVLRSETEQALRLGNNETNYRDTLSKQLEHVELLARTVSDLMELAQSESEQIKLNREKEDLSELVQTAVDGMRDQAGERGIKISATVQQNVIGAFDAARSGGCCSTCWIMPSSSTTAAETLTWHCPFITTLPLFRSPIPEAASLQTSRHIFLSAVIVPVQRGNPTFPARGWDFILPATSRKLMADKLKYRVHRVKDHAFEYRCPW